jgi:hypothetical protein
MNRYKTNKFSHGAGCVTELSPKVLTTILESNKPKWKTPSFGSWYRVFLPCDEHCIHFFLEVCGTLLGDVALGGKPLMACNTGMALEWVAWWLLG